MAQSGEPYRQRAGARDEEQTMSEHARPRGGVVVGVSGEPAPASVQVVVARQKTAEERTAAQIDPLRTAPAAVSAR
jgi:hypothetical protein